MFVPDQIFHSFQQKANLARSELTDLMAAFSFHFCEKKREKKEGGWGKMEVGDGQVKGGARNNREVVGWLGNWASYGEEKVDAVQVTRMAKQKGKLGAS